MKSVLISIRPKYCELIASGKKTIEVRKTRPKIETPFKCYIYQTIDGGAKGDIIVSSGLQCGKVIGEFVCDSIDEYTSNERGWYCYDLETCLRCDEIAGYGKGEPLYGWRISDLEIYDKPKELSEFKRYCNGICLNNKKGIICEKVKRKEQEIWINCNGLVSLTRPPQSWCYVEGK